MIRPARYKESRLTDDGEAITALASFQNYVAAGNARGVVRVLELRGNGVGD
jgi:predicted phage tail protein